jgi:tetratricopeptide (TPR) repeat protein
MTTIGFCSQIRGDYETVQPTAWCAANDPPLSPSAKLQQASELATIKHNYPAAIEQMEAVVDECPGSDLALAATFRIAHIQNFYQGNYAEAVKTYRTVIAARPKTEWAANAMFDLALAQQWGLRDNEAAAETYRQISAEFPGSGFDQKAKETLKLAGRKVPVEGMGCLLGQPTGSLQSCLDEARFFGSHAASQKSRGYYMVAFKYFSLGKYREAQALFTAAASLDNKSFRGGDALLFAGLSALYAGEAKNALDLLLAARGRIGGQYFSAHDVPWYTFDPAEIVKSRHPSDDDWVNAMSAYNYSTLTRAYTDILIGSLLRQQGDRAAALDHFELAAKALRKPPYSFRNITLLASAFLDLDRPDKAAALYDSVKPRDPRMRRALSFEVANLQARSANYAAALEAYSAVIKGNPDDDLGFQSFLAADYIKKVAMVITPSSNYLGYFTASPDSLLLTYFDRKPVPPLKYLGRRQLDPAIAAEAYRDNSGQTGDLLFLHGRPVTYIPGNVKSFTWGLAADYADGIRAEFPDPAVTLSGNNALRLALDYLPAGFFRDATIVMSDHSSFSAKLIFVDGRPQTPAEIVNGEYTYQPAVTLYPVSRYNVSTLRHELAHFFDLARAGQWRDPFNPLFLFRKINFQQAGGELIFRERSRPDFSVPKPLANKSLMSIEDFAYLSDNYMEDQYCNLAWKEMARGNFRPAAKYLFMRFLTPFAGLEYGDSPILGFEEVEAELARNGKKVSASTRQVLAEIKRHWENHSEFTCQDTISY